MYEFDVCFQPPTLIHETFEMIKPGLSSFNEDAAGAAKSLDVLLEVAMKVVSESAKGCTPIAVKATAGLRMLGEEKSNNILLAIRQHLENDFPFAVVKDDGVSVMGGDQEGVFAWITTNYLLGKIGTSKRKATSAIFDLGGGSTQIVFEPSFEGNEQMVEGEHKYELKFGRETYTLYQFSHLGYGLNAARNAIFGKMVNMALANHKIIDGDTLSKHRLVSPCLPPDIELEDVEVTMASGFTYKVNFFSSSTESGPHCRNLAEQILEMGASCTAKPCSINGIHQPSLVHTFREPNDMYIFSYFYDRTQSLGLPSTFTLKQLKDLSKTVCKGPVEWKKAFSKRTDIIEELYKDPYYCMDLSYQVILLQEGYNIPLSRKLKTSQTIAGNEIGWCLGAALPLIESDTWDCRVAQTS